MITIITAPEILINLNKYYSIFLAGSIEMGMAEPWQDKIIQLIKDRCKDEFYDTCILNPRRSDWNSNWEQDINNPQFKAQVTWELDAMNMADRILMYFDPNTKAPITLLELGYHAKSGKLSVVCPDGFWRKGNVDIICERHNIPQYETIEEIWK